MPIIGSGIFGFGKSTKKLAVLATIECDDLTYRYDDYVVRVFPLAFSSSLYASHILDIIQPAHSTLSGRCVPIRCQRSCCRSCKSAILNDCFPGVD